MHIRYFKQRHDRGSYWITFAGALLLCTSVNAASPEESGRQIEEVIVTAERQESSVQDTSISITAFTSELIEDFGIRNQSDMQNLIPATIILPYDAAIRGVGRNLRSLGGDPGISTYMNGVYSEDLYTATIQSLWDVERIEILRGPQGTLYGRNAIGGAMNFIYKEPTQEFESEIKGVVGGYGTRDINAVVSGGLIENVLAGRFSVARRQHDGYIDEIGPGPDTDSGDQLSIVGQLLWTPTENLQVKLRKNDIDVDRTMGGADGGGLIVFRGESVDGLSRDQDTYAFGYRPIDYDVTDPLNRGFYDANSPVYTFNHPTDGTSVTAQGIRPGVDRVLATTSTGTKGTVGLPNYAYGLTNDDQESVFTDLKNIKGEDLCAQTNGKNMEDFDQQGTQLEAAWDLSDTVSLKYIYGESDLLYQRITDDDSSYSTTLDRQFYVNHEADYTSHELQAFYDLNDRLSVTSGIFFYDAEINQRGDFYSETNDPRFLNADPISQAVAQGNPAIASEVNLYSARDLNAADGTTLSALGAWNGDAGGTSIAKGPNTAATDLEYHTRTIRDAFAAYTQGVLEINEEFTLTVGARYAVDEIFGEENLMRYSEEYVPPAALAAMGITSLAALNIYRGALDATTLQPTGTTHLLTTGIPMNLAVHRHMNREDKKWTGRINLDWAFADNMMVYANVTSGYRSGGYNLGFFSTTATYDPEELVAYEIGYKGQHLDNTLQIFGSVYLYDYSNIHTFGAEPSATGGVTTSVLEAKGAQITGLETEITWLITEELSIGGNVSFTPSEYTDTRLLANVADPRVPNSPFSAADIYYNIKGNQLLNVPEQKGLLYGIYERSLDDLGSIKFLANYSWVDKVYHTPFADELDATPRYDRLDLRAIWTNNDESITVSAFVNNVFDKIGIRQLETHEESQGFRRTGQVTEPRVIGAEFSLKLGGP